jgi:trehalose-6-phosphate synthase
MLEHFDIFFEDHPEWRENSDLVVMPPTAEEAVEEWDDLDGEVQRRVDSTKLTRRGRSN